MPCISIVPFTGGTACNCANPADGVSTLVGDPSQLYDVTFLFRGIIEYAKYTGGSVVSGSGGAAISGGTPVADGHNQYSLIVSNPAQTIYLNGWDGVPANYGNVHAIRYSITLHVNSGSVITLRANNGGDGIEITNLGNLIITPLMGEPALNALVLPQPYQTPGTNGQGQWLQTDATLIV